MKDESLFKKNYNAYLKRQMVLNGVTLRELAGKTGYSYEGIRQIIKGNGSYKGVFKICNALDIKMKNLMNDELLK